MAHETTTGRREFGQGDDDRLGYRRRDERRIDDQAATPSIHRDQSSASNALRAHDDVVHVAALFHWRSCVPVILEEDCVEPVVGETTEPVDVSLTCLDEVVDPQLEHTV